MPQNTTPSEQDSQSVEGVDLPNTDDGKVLIVDDEESLTDLHAHRVGKTYTSIPAYSGSEALEKIDPSIDVVLLDRRMPKMTGGEVLTKIRDQGYPCNVVMVTAVDPDEDIKDMPCDEYLKKPVGKNELLHTVEEQMEARRYNRILTEINRVQSKIDALDAQHTSPEIENMDVYQELTSQLEVLKEMRENHHK
jgi:DNA-binding response OmpR family regulator